MAFIDQVAALVQKYAPEYGIKVCSPIIAQAILESASGTSDLAVNANNFFGLKYRPNRCPTASGTYFKVGSEQLQNGEYVSSLMKWFKFPDMEAGIIGYFDFINVAAYQNLKGVTDPGEYLQKIKADGYATALDYVSRVMAVINKYNLTQYDEGKKMIINVHAGHNPDGMKACGAIGLIKESTQARLVKNKLIELLRAEGHTVYDCTCENGTSQNNVLSKIVAKCKEEDRYQVQRDLLRAYRAVFKDHGIDLSFDQVVVSQYQATDIKATKAIKKEAEQFVEEQKELSEGMEQQTKE